MVQPSSTTAILTDTPETDVIGEETKAKTKEVSTRQQTTPESKKEKTQSIKKTRSTQRAQTSLAEADHYSHIPAVKMLGLGGERLPPPPPPSPPQKKNHYLHCDLGMLPLLWCFFAHLLILEYPDHHQNLISSSLYYLGPLHKMSSQSVHNFMSNVHRQTNKQTNATKNITSFAKEVKT